MDMLTEAQKAANKAAYHARHRAYRAAVEAAETLSTVSCCAHQAAEAEAALNGKLAERNAALVAKPCPDNPSRYKGGVS